MSLIGFITELSSEPYKQKLLADARALAYEAGGSVQTLEQLRRERATLIGGYSDYLSDYTTVSTAYYESYVVLALASAYASGVRDEDDLLYTILPASLNDLTYMEEFLSDTLNEKVTEAQFDARLLAYLAAPAFFWALYGADLLKRRGGASQARRNCVRDDKSCEDCIKYENRGWVNLNDPLPLPLPGQDCSCYRNCRCSIEYK